MSYLVDGNNLMRGSRRALMDELADYARAKGIRVAVVFDGAPEEHFGDGAGYRGIRVYYAERQSDADARIKQMVEASRERKTLVVVTSDRALGDYVRRCGARVISAEQFRRDMATAARRAMRLPKQESKNKPVEEKELSGWLRYFGVDEEDADEQR